MGRPARLARFTCHGKGARMAVYITARHMTGGTQHEHIARVRWHEATDASKTGENSRQEMVDWIKDKKGDAYVHSGDGRVDVGVVEASPPYLRTYANGVWTDNLLSLPTF